MGKVLTRSVPGGSPLKSLALLLACLYGGLQCVTHVDAAASEALLGGQYVPTTDVGFIEDLTELIEAIATESDPAQGQLFYSKYTPDSTFSLESIGSDLSSTILNTATNPLYALYLHGYYRSVSGNGHDSDVDRDDMMFLNNKVDYYGHTIITDEFTKASGYDSNLNAETIRVTNMWMATIQSLYDSSALCHTGPDGLDQLTFVSPIDKAAAFYYGTHEDESSVEGGSLYAWAARTRNLFSGDSGWNANDVVKEGLTTLQATLTDCLTVWDTDITDEQEYEMDKLVNALANGMTVPLVQNLIYYANEVAESDAVDATTVDYLILYALATLPPLRVCDASSFDTLYQNFVTNASTLTTTVLAESLSLLFKSFTCLGVTCDQVGIPDSIIVPMSIDLPACTDPPMNLEVAGYQGTYDRMLESAIVDLDVLTIGALIEMEANNAAQNVYWWNKYGLSLSQTMDDVSLNDMALAVNHDKNTIAADYDAEYPIDDLVTSVIKKTGVFDSASSLERREVVEILLATVVLPIYALDSMYNAIDVCDNNPGQQDTSEWDKAVASLIGFAEGRGDGVSDNGRLFYNLANTLCASAGTCNESNIAKVNDLLMAEFNDGKDQLLSSNCASAEEHIYNIEVYLQTILIDAVASAANEIKNDPTNKLYAASGYAYGTALYPLVFDESEAETVLKNSLGVFGKIDSGYMDSVLDGLKGYVERHNLIDCNLINNIICEEFSGTTSTAVTSITAMFTASPAGWTEVNYPTYSPTVTPRPTEVSNPTIVLSSNPPVGVSYPPVGFLPSVATYYPTYLPSVTARPTASGVLDGGVLAISDGTVSLPLYSGAYTPTSNVDHIIKLVGLLDEIQIPGTSKDGALAFYTQEIEPGLSLKSLSTAPSWNYVTNINPLQIIYMYGLWTSGDGDQDSNGYSNKRFDDGALEEYGNSIIMDGFNKKSGFDEKLTAETIRVTNVWMAMVTELYKAVESCRDGTASDTEQGFNPVDHAAAFWFGSSQDSDENDGGSLFAWTARAGSNFVNQSTGVNTEMITALNGLQTKYAECKELSLTDAFAAADHMSKQVLYITQLMTVPLVQNFITDLATKSGKSANERDYLILYSVALLPQLSICDEDVLNSLFSDLVINNASFDGSQFGPTLKLLQDRYECLGIHCSLVGNSISSDSSWPACVDTADPNFIPLMAGYQPYSKASTELSKIDLDVSTILSFIVMEANDAAWDVYKNGRNVVGDDGSYISIHSLKLPTHPSVVDIYNKFNSDYGINYLELTESAIQGTGNFASTTPLQNSAAASLALVAMDLHIAILENLYQAVLSCQVGDDSLVYRALFDRAAALIIGWTEGRLESGSDTDGYLFFQIAQEVCEYFSSCDVNGDSAINTLLNTSFNNGAGIISNNLGCDTVEEEVGIIETYLQAILIDNLIYHLNSAEQDERHYLLAHVSAFALLPFMQAVDKDSADVVEQELGGYPTDLYLPDGIQGVYSAIKSYVDIKGIDCSLLSSSICEGVPPSDVDSDSVAVPNDSGLTLANDEYTPFTDVTDLMGLSTTMSKMCHAQDSASAKSIYTDDDSNGFTLQSLSLTAKDVMSNEVLFNQYIYSFMDDVDKTDGSLLFDQLPAVEYSNTITSDAIDENVALGCLSVKVLSMWMWVIHKLNDSIEECKAGDSSQYGSIDKAAAFWIGSVSADDNGGLLYELAEQLGEQFSHKEGEYMTTLNREIISRLNLAQATYFVNSNRCTTDANAVSELRKIVKEITSYMTAVLIQGFIHSMIETSYKKEAFVELYAFAVLPHIARCGHESLKDSLYEDIVNGEFDPALTPTIINTLHDQLNCLGLKCDDIGRHVLADEVYPECQDDFDMLGYTPVNATKTNMPAKLDLDAVAIHQLMSLEKFSLAKEIYTNGHNYYDYDDETKFGFVSLQRLTKSETIGETDFYTYKLYSDYLSKNPGNFVDEFILSAFDKMDNFDKTTAKQRELAVTTAIKSFVSYMSALEALNLAVSSCDSNKQRAQTAWDGGAALLIGSVEGKKDAADYVNQTSDGQMFFSISDGLCQHFDLCTSIGSTVTEDLLSLLIKGQGHIADSACSDATDTLQSIVQLCTVSLIQNAIYFGDMSSDDDTLAAGYIAGMAVLPWVNEVDSEAATVIKKDMRFRQSSITDGEASAVLDAFKSFVSNPSSNIDCEAVSNVRNMCSAPEIPASVNLDEPSVLSDGLYTASNYVSDRATISFDIRDIHDKITANNLDGAIELYNNGANSPIYSTVGQLTGKRSISKFSTDAAANMKKNPIYNRFLFGLADRSQEFLGSPVTSYADSMVRELLYSHSYDQQTVAPDAMVILNIWMQVVQKMYSAYYACKSGDGDPSLFIDESAAYWIGDSQAAGSSTQGHLLYALTEYMGQKYESTPKGSQSDINTRVLDLFNQAKNHIALTNSCSASPTSHVKMRNIVDELVPLLAVPLLRALFYYVSTREAAKIKAYAVSVLPLFSTCSKSIFLELKGDLIDGDPFFVDKDRVFSRIQSMYECLGVTCDLVGFMTSNNYTHCQESTTHDQMAGFSYIGDYDSVVEHSKIDIEIRNIEAFIDNGLNIFPTDVEDFFGLGHEFYQYQQYSDSASSLKDLATSEGRELVPSYASFRRYFDDDVDYADTIITNAFKKEGLFASATTEDRRKVISFSMRYMVTYMAVLESLYTSLDLCRDSLKPEAHESLDEAAAYFVGSLEGEEDGGTYDGVLLFMLANRMCVHFGTCSTSNIAQSNEKIISLLYAAQGEIDVGACDSLAKTVKGIENALTVPLIQGTLYTALENDLYLSKVVQAEDLLPEGYALAQSVLPLIHDVDSSAASDIADVMVKGFPKTQNLAKAGNHAKVFRAMQAVIPKMNGLDCTMVGTIAGVSFCSGAELASNSGVQHTSWHSTLGLLTSTLIILFIV